MGVFGSETWIKHGEVFAIFFGLFARFAPTEPRIHKQSGAHGLALRPFGVGLLANVPASPSMVAFVLLVLSSVLYDGLLTTPEWAEAEQQLINLMPGLGEPGSVVVSPIGLVAFCAALLAAYLAVSAIMLVAARCRWPLHMAHRLAQHLAPVAIA